MEGLPSMYRRCHVNALLNIEISDIAFLQTLLLAIAVVFIFGSYNGDEHLERLPVLTAADVATAQTGQEVFVVGTLGTSAPAGPARLIAYERQRYTYNMVSKSHSWSTETTTTPPFKMTTSTGVVHVPNSDYRLDHLTVTQTEGKDLRYVGLPMGSQITVRGVIDHTATGPVVRATLLYGGDQDTLIVQRRGQLLVLRGGGWLVIIVVVLQLVLERLRALVHGCREARS